METTLEWFGATTYRLRTKSITIFLDSWLDRPSTMAKYLSVDDVEDADYIFISHAHFDHLPGADRIALKTGAVVIANPEAINVLRQAGVAEAQLVPVAGGERIPLFTKKHREMALTGEIETATGPPGKPATPHEALAVASVHVWPSLHCLMPGMSHADVPDIMDTGKEYKGSASQYAGTLDITFGMKYGLLRLGHHMPREKMDDGMRSFVDYVDDRKRNVFSHCDGGQLMFNFLIGNQTLLWMAHLGGYEGVLRTLQPKPDVIIMAIAGRANLNGRPFDGSAAQFARDVLSWLGEPKRTIWCLHDHSCIKPYRADVGPATAFVEQETRTKVLDLQPAQKYPVFEVKSWFNPNF